MQRWMAVFGSVAFLAGCAGAPRGVVPISGFEVERYLGQWHEIARLDHSFERGLTDVSARYSMRADGGLDVVNRGFDAKAGKWKEARGRAYFTGESDFGQLKVTFFWPFYGGYNIIELDRENYSHALVCGPSRSYLWILAREKTLDRAVRDSLVAKASALGFDTDALIFLDRPDPN